jgi:hypothetical protein
MRRGVSGQGRRRGSPARSLPAAARLAPALLVAALLVSGPGSARAATTRRGPSPGADLIGTWSAPDPLDPAAAVVLEVVAVRPDGDLVGTVQLGAPPGPGVGEKFVILDGRVAGRRFHFTLEQPGTVPDRSGYEAVWSGTATGSKVVATIVATRWSALTGSATSTVSIVASRSGPVVTISGAIELACVRVCRASGPEPLADVEVVASGAEVYRATTDAAGVYAFVVPTGRYTLTPEEPDLSFNPPTRPVAASGPFAGLDFVACAATGAVPEPAVRAMTRAAPPNAEAATAGCPSALLAADPGAPAAAGVAGRAYTGLRVRSRAHDVSRPPPERHPDSLQGALHHGRDHPVRGDPRRPRLAVEPSPAPLGPHPGRHLRPR